MSDNLMQLYFFNIIPHVHQQSTHCVQERLKYYVWSTVRYRILMISTRNRN